MIGRLVGVKLDLDSAHRGVHDDDRLARGRRGAASGKAEHRGGQGQQEKAFHNDCPFAIDRKPKPARSGSSAGADSKPYRPLECKRIARAGRPGNRMTRPAACATIRRTEPATKESAMYPLSTLSRPGPDRGRGPGRLPRRPAAGCPELRPARGQAARRGDAQGDRGKDREARQGLAALRQQSVRDPCWPRWRSTTRPPSGSCATTSSTQADAGDWTLEVLDRGLLRASQAARGRVALAGIRPAAPSSAPTARASTARCSPTP